MVDGEREIFMDSMGVSHIMGYGYCPCYVWYVSWQPGRDYAGRCGRCGEGVLLLPPSCSEEQALARFENEYGRKPTPLS